MRIVILTEGRNTEGYSPDVTECPPHPLPLTPNALLMRESKLIRSIAKQLRLAVVS
jgi:hypothetical protein